MSIHFTLYLEAVSKISIYLCNLNHLNEVKKKI